MKRALCLIRESLVYRRGSFIRGLQAAKYTVESRIDKPTADDVVVIWNRYGHGEEVAQQFERAGGQVVVVENGYFGKGWLGDRWFAAALGQHNGAGAWPAGGPERWESFNVTPQPWRTGGKERIILAQRGIGSSEVRSPGLWAEKVQRTVGGRIRAHPGNDEPKVLLDDDLTDAASVVTWGSSAALKALLLGVPVWYDFPKWIGAVAARPLSEFRGPNGTLAPVKRSDEDRLAMFHRLAWAMWRASEVESGEMFRVLLAREKVAA